MLPKIAYLSWAIETFPHAKWDLATSGLPSISAAELGQPSDLSDPKALQTFARKVAERYGVAEKNVMPALGTSGAVWIAAAAVLGGLNGADVLVEEPTYEPLLRAFEGFGAKVRRVRRRAEDGWRLDPKRVEEALREDTKLVVMASPHNPTGVPASDEDIAAIAKVCTQRGVYLLVDEVYRELVAPKTSAFGLGSNVIAVSSLTKCFGLGWARAGWVMLPDELRAGARSAEMLAAGVLPTTCGAIGAFAMDKIEALAARADVISAGKRAVVNAFMAKHPELLWTPPPEKALFGFVYTTNVNVTAGLARAATEHGVVAVNGAFFDEPSGFRISWASLQPDRLEAALATLAGCLGLAE
ncbi:MAG: pyridoxal phosphate-dependent aminotransferase [Polyangiaceae bacterium]|nr:pyridoxal phosphate-dependent aminotransferase [Polyangiaceae bacterium]